MSRATILGLVRFGLALAALAAVAAPGGSASAADYPGYGGHHRAHAHHPHRHVVRVEPARRPAASLYRDFSGALPACSDPSVIGYVAGRFAATERGYWNSNLQLATVDRPRELGYRSWGNEFIPRRFCAARTFTSDGRKRQLYYEIGEGFAFASLGWDVNWCVTGLDRSTAYGGHCRAAQP